MSKRKHKKNKLKQHKPRDTTELMRSSVWLVPMPTLLADRLYAMCGQTNQKPADVIKEAVATLLDARDAALAASEAKIQALLESMTSD